MALVGIIVSYIIGYDNFDMVWCMIALLSCFEFVAFCFFVSFIFVLISGRKNTESRAGKEENAKKDKLDVFFGQK